MGSGLPEYSIFWSETFNNTLCSYLPFVFIDFLTSLMTISSKNAVIWQPCTGFANEIFSCYKTTEVKQHYVIYTGV